MEIGRRSSTAGALWALALVVAFARPARADVVPGGAHVEAFGGSFSAEGSAGGTGFGVRGGYDFRLLSVTGNLTLYPDDDIAGRATAGGGTYERWSLGIGADVPINRADPAVLMLHFGVAVVFGKATDAEEAEAVTRESVAFSVGLGGRIQLGSSRFYLRPDVRAVLYDRDEVIFDLRPSIVGTRSVLDWQATLGVGVTFGGPRH